jgi:hypothetical protein
VAGDRSLHVTAIDRIDLQLGVEASLIDLAVQWHAVPLSGAVLALGQCLDFQAIGAARTPAG